MLSLVERALPPRLDAALAPFVKGLRRRLGRDQDRLHHYHNDLHREAMRRALALPGDDPRRRREEQRAEAIGLEYRAKLDDLARQYATRVTVEWVQTLELAMPVHRFTVQIRRRKADRVILLDWNPLARALEPPACEFTASTERPRLVCDDALHLVFRRAGSVRGLRPGVLPRLPSGTLPEMRRDRTAACWAGRPEHINERQVGPSDRRNQLIVLTVGTHTHEVTPNNTPARRQCGTRYSEATGGPAHTRHRC